MKIYLFWLALFVFSAGLLAQDFEDEPGLTPNDFKKTRRPVKAPVEEEPGLTPDDFKKRPEKPDSDLGKKPSAQVPPQDEKPETSKQPKDDEPAPEQPAGDGARGMAPVRVSENTTTWYITISGALGVYYIFRDDFFDDAVQSNASNSLDEDYFDPRVVLNFDARLEKNVRAVVELQNEARDEQLHRTSLGNLHVTSRAATNNFQFEFEKAYLELSEFLLDRFTLQAGIIPHRYSLRSDGQAFFLDLREAESPFSTRPDTHATGAVMSYRPIREVDFYADAFYLVTSESGFNRRDETVMGVNIDLNLTKDLLRESDEEEVTLVRLFNLNFAGIQGDSNTPLWNLGFGFSYFFAESAEIEYTIELYGEILFQFGEYDRKNLPPPFSVRDQDHLALGSYAGFRWMVRKGGWRPFIDVSYWYLSGDDNDPNADKNRDIVSYENIDSTLIIEDNDYGLDIDSNYWAVKCQVGTNLPIEDEEIRLAVIYAYFETNDSPSGRTHRLGNEIDVRLTWEYTTDMIFSCAAGVLWESQYLEEFFDEVGAQGEEHAFLLRAEASLVF